MLKLELSHVWPTKADGTTDYASKMVEFDYSHLRETQRDIVVRKYNYDGKESSYTQTFVTFGAGLTLEYASHYIGDGDSVGSVAVWDPIAKKPVWFGLGYEGSNTQANIVYDATPEVKAEYQAWKKAQEIEQAHQAAIYEDQDRTAEIEAEKTRPTKGKTVRVVRGRKVPVGTIAKVFWYGETQGRFGGTRVGLEVVDDIAGRIRVFTSASNVEVVTEVVA